MPLLVQARTTFESVFRARRLTAYLLPTTPMLPPKLNDFDEASPLGRPSPSGIALALFNAACELVHPHPPPPPITRFATLGSALSLCAVSVPTGFSYGLPTAMTLAAPAGSDIALLQLAAAYEAERGPLGSTYTAGAGVETSMHAGALDNS